MFCCSRVALFSQSSVLDYPAQRIKGIYRFFVELFLTTTRLPDQKQMRYRQKGWEKDEQHKLMRKALEFNESAVRGTGANMNSPLKSLSVTNRDTSQIKAYTLLQRSVTWFANLNSIFIKIEQDGTDELSISTNKKLQWLTHCNTNNTSRQQSHLRAFLLLVRLRASAASRAWVGRPCWMCDVWGID